VTDSIWVVMPILNNLQMSLDAIGDCLNQSVPTRLLLINQGSDTEVREALEREAELRPDRIFLWSHVPSLPSLSASWNRALDFVWSTGGTEALVVNNDVRISSGTVEYLQKSLHRTSALFVSAVAVAEVQYDPAVLFDIDRLISQRGGPDFSCYLISKAGHQQYRFDENFIPCYTEDLDLHRRFMLGGDGDKIFSVNLPYLHFASGTLKDMTPEKRAAKERAIGQSRAYYERKWGGPVNQEIFFSPFDQGVEGISTAGMPNPPTTPKLQAWVQAR